MSIFAIDPGPEQSAMVAMRPDGLIYSPRIFENEVIRDLLHHWGGHPDAKGKNPDFQLVIEMIASFGMPVGKEVFETCVWIGRFIEAFQWEERTHRLTRNEVKMHLCHSMRAKDSNIRQALLDRFGPVGTKKKPGPLYGVKADIWSALAVAVTFYDRQNGKS